jgi:phage shock protein PspC (stress-responsive transcriptional regulator)
MSTEPKKAGAGPKRPRRRRKIKDRGPWDSVCGNCGRYIKGVRMTRGRPWRKVLPYCTNCGRYALRGVHVAALAVVLVPLAAAALLLALYLLLWLITPGEKIYETEDPSPGPQLSLPRSALSYGRAPKGALAIYERAKAKPA